jgi:acyl-CoA thioesterase-2
LMDLVDEAKDVFVGPPSPDPGSRTFGGQLLAQSLGAAQRTVSGDRSVHSTHSYFLKAADAAEPIELRVKRLRDGRSFSQRQVVALQGGAEVCRSLISFQVPEHGLEWEEPITIDVALPTNEQAHADDQGRPMDVSYINAPAAPEGTPVTEPQLRWMRVHGQLGDDRPLHDAGLAYLADVGMNAVILLPHGFDWRDEQITEASLDHAMWFHRPARADDWLYYDQRVESTSSGRGLARGRFYDLDGHLVATCMQEGLMRHWSAAPPDPVTNRRTTQPNG